MGISVCEIANNYQESLVDTQLLGASRKVYVFAPYQFRKTFSGFPESVRTPFTEDIRTDSEIRCL